MGSLSPSSLVHVHGVTEQGVEPRQGGPSPPMGLALTPGPPARCVQWYHIPQRAGGLTPAQGPCGVYPGSAGPAKHPGLAGVAGGPGLSRLRERGARRSEALCWRQTPPLPRQEGEGAGG